MNTQTLSLLERVLKALEESVDDVTESMAQLPTYKADYERRLIASCDQLDKHKSCIKDLTATIAAERSKEQAKPQQECNPHPDAPHGFNRNASHSAGRYVCECQGWSSDQADALLKENTMPVARSLTDELMDCVDRLGSEKDKVDPRVWDHLLVYAPKPRQEPDFIKRTNKDYADWCATFYTPEALDARGMMSLNGLHAWQERERRAMLTSPQPLKPLSDEEIEALGNEDRFWSDSFSHRIFNWFEFARAIEAKLGVAMT